LTIIIASNGWIHKSWIDNFYPTDLPEAWRLAYYANEFSAVLVSEEDWLKISDNVLEDLLSDVSGDFHFFIAQGQNSSESIKTKIQNGSYEKPVTLIKFNENYSASPLGYEFADAEILTSNCVLENSAIIRVSSDNVMELSELRHMLENAIEQYVNYQEVYLIFSGRFLEMATLQSIKALIELISE